MIGRQFDASNISVELSSALGSRYSWKRN